MFSLPGENWLRLFVWLAIGFAIYFGYGKAHSVLARGGADRFGGAEASGASVPTKV